MCFFLQFLKVYFVLHSYLGEILNKVVFFFFTMKWNQWLTFFFVIILWLFELPAINLVRANMTLTKFDTAVLIGQKKIFRYEKIPQSEPYPAWRKDMAWNVLVHSTLVLFQTYFITRSIFLFYLYVSTVFPSVC